jgi:integrase
VTEKQDKEKRAPGEGTYRYRPKEDLHEWRSPYGFPVQKTLYAKTKKDLFAKVRQFYRDVDRGVNFDAQKLTVGDYLDTWLEESVEGSVWYTTWRDYERMCRLHIKPTLGRVKLQELTKMHVQRLINEKTRQGYSPRAVRYIHTTLSKALNQAVDWDLVQRNVASRVKLPRMKRTKRETLTVTNVAAFFAAAERDRFAALYVLAVTSGLRPQELLGLKWEDLDLDRGVLFIRRVVSEDEIGFVLKEETKTSGGRRLELSSVGIEALKRHRIRQHQERLKYRGVWVDLDLVFPSTKGTIMRRNNLHRRSYKPLLWAAGLPDIRLYDLRHTFATLMFENDEQLKLVSEMLGHSSIKQTADTYTHVAPTIHRDAARRLDDFLSRHLPKA